MSETMSDSCPFCAVTGATFFHEGALVRALWDAHPVTEGHALVITRRHVGSWFDATEEEQAELLAAVKVVREVISSRYGAEGFNIGVNVGEAAGQTVPHLHVHVIPRRLGDQRDPRGGVRNVIPAKGNYLKDLEPASMVAEGEPESLWGDHPRPAIVGTPVDPLLKHLISHLDSAVEADLVVAFVLESGVDALETALRGFMMRGGRLRLLTGDYLGVTDPAALRRLLDLKDYAREGEEFAEERFQIRVHETGKGSFHPKAYLFRFLPAAEDWTPGEGIAYVGSSNMTRTALLVGTEWNYRVIPERDRLGFVEVERSFEELFTAGHTRPLDMAWIEEYEARRPVRPPASPEVPEEPTLPPPQPHVIQQEALTALATTRREGNRSGLVVMATGLGKTWLAAFDVARMQSRKVLFVAHREEILKQAKATFRRIRPNARLGYYRGGRYESDAEVLFASIQTLGTARHLERFARSAFDYVVVDEFHHAAAATYRRVIDHFEPDFLLGLTATPERTDGGSLLALCGENLVYRCDLFDGIRRAPDRLVPFHYFGIPDDVDYQAIPWRSRRFDPEELEQALATTKRADNALDQWRTRAGTRTLAFCCSMVHADFMAAHFRDAGVQAVALHSGPTSAPRATSLDAFAAGEIEVLFTVDILNEGVDIPDTDTVLMLRPTASRIVFLQQLGRGLRAAEGKEHLTVVDYIGNHRSFKLKPSVLLGLGPGDAHLRAALRRLQEKEYEALELPPGCEVTYELEAIQLLEDQIASGSAADALVRWYQEFEERVGRRPCALDAFHEGRNPRSTRSAHGSWLRFVAARGGLSAGLAQLLGANELAGAFLDELERTRMSRSFKMVLLLGMLQAGGFPRPIAIDELTEMFRTLARRSAAVSGEVGPSLDDTSSLRAYLIQNPINAWCRPKGGNRVYFKLSGDDMLPLMKVPSALVDDFTSAVREIAEWRLADHLSGQPSELEAGWRIICKVWHSNGNPILKLPNRAHFEGIPEGDLRVRVEEDREYIVRFTKIAVNFVTSPGSDTNVLSDLLRVWFGDLAGTSGTSQFVAFTHLDGEWSFGPLGAGEASRAVVERATEKGGNRHPQDAGGKVLDATYHVERSEGQYCVVFHSAGGTAGTAAALNREYAAGLEALLMDLHTRRIQITDILLDTNQTRDDPLDERRLNLRGDRRYPLDLSEEEDLTDLRRAISAAQGNNPNRRIRIVLGLSEGSNLEGLQ